MKLFEIWAEGHIATGSYSKATLLGVVKGETFDDAVERFMFIHACRFIHKLTEKDFTSKEAYNNRLGNYIYWGCYLFDNKEAASVRYG